MSVVAHKCFETLVVLVTLKLISGNRLKQTHLGVRGFEFGVQVSSGFGKSDIIASLFSLGAILIMLDTLGQLDES